MRSRIIGLLAVALVTIGLAANPPQATAVTASSYRLAPIVMTNMGSIPTQHDHRRDQEGG